MAVVSQWMGHSDVNLTVKRYGRFAAEAKEQFAWINALGQPVEAPAKLRLKSPNGRKDCGTCLENLP